MCHNAEPPLVLFSFRQDGASFKVCGSILHPYLWDRGRERGWADDVWILASSPFHYVALGLLFHLQAIDFSFVTWKD